MSENDSTEIIRNVNNSTIELDRIYSKADLDEIMGLNRDVWNKWHKMGLKKLNTRTAEAYYNPRALLKIWEEWKEEV